MSRDDILDLLNLSNAGWSALEIAALKGQSASHIRQLQQAYRIKIKGGSKKQGRGSRNRSEVLWRRMWGKKTPMFGKNMRVHISPILHKDWGDKPAPTNNIQTWPILNDTDWSNPLWRS
jgi:hypothetical protein